MAKKEKQEEIIEKIVDENKESTTETKKLDEQELAQLQSSVRTIDQLTHEVGTIEVRKHALMKAMESVQGRIETFRNQLVQKYGTDNINIQTGEITEAPKNPNTSENGEANKKD